ncbi:site-specific DNA-methyltransferase [Pleomorphomonas carboxyditropha]|uniref:site-specific DNA-methyltransferase (adenine-specific) n=1 Tax=Pleomorphomonas carboxyditropha TaxID=2023338 RepID=A0A2G9WUD3_9HYPH|nr:site-specific DNA-methyltransferase [Pleomorphomonas carboxyditropha]PIO98274.1 site-specific DNA-methyltransferase [Pleomorphomonas carboxyditropha]
MAKKPLDVDALKHGDTRKNIPTAEFESVMDPRDKTPIEIAYERRNRDLDPQLVWRGKDMTDWSDLIVQAPPLYIQEKVHPKVIIDDLRRETAERRREAAPPVADLFGDFNGLPDLEAKTEFYQHDQHWSNRMIAGDSLSVMASLAEREGLRGKVQCIYFDPPYGIKFNSNFQWSTTSRDVKDGAKDHFSREPEQVRAFRDTWKDGIHSYLGYLRDRLTVARELLSESGSIFVQIGDENVHRVRAVMDEVFGDENFVITIPFVKKGNQKGNSIESINDYILWFAKNRSKLKSRILFKQSSETEQLERDFKRVVFECEDLDLASFSRRVGETEPLSAAEISSRFPDARLYTSSDLTVGGTRTNQSLGYNFQGSIRDPGIDKNRCWMHTARPLGNEKYCGLDRMRFAGRILLTGAGGMRRRVFLDDSGVTRWSNWWDDTGIAGFASDKIYVVQTNTKVIERCILMSTDPGDLVIDPTCGSGATAFVAEQWGRRWITIDTSRVAIALARSRLMGARYPFYLLADSQDGQRKEAEVKQTAPRTAATHNDIRLGFVYRRAPQITSSLVANNTEIDTIWDKWLPKVEAALTALNNALKDHATPFMVTTGGREGKVVDFRKPGTIKLPSGEDAPTNALLDWEVPREAPQDWPEEAKASLYRFWEARVTRQKEIDASIAAKAEFEYLYDKPYVDNSKVRVAGPFTVESLSPHRTLAVDWDDELIDILEASEGKRTKPEGIGRDDAVTEFAHMILENLRTAGVQQAHKEDRISFTSLTGWPGEFICAEGRFMEGERERRAGVFIGPEFGTVSRPDLVAAAREAGDAGFDILIACAFNYDAHSAEFDKLGRVPVLKARMNPDLHMAKDLKATGAGNLFVVFGEPDVEISEVGGGKITVKVSGVDVFKPQTGEVVSEGTDGIALWMLDTDYNEESFFVRHAYFLGANDPYKALKTMLKAEIDQEAWDSLYSDISRPFPKPKSGRIAVKVINHLGDEVMKVFAVG